MSTKPGEPLDHESPKSPSLNIQVKKEPSAFPTLSPDINYATLDSEEDEEGTFQAFSPGLRALCVNSPTDSDGDLPDLGILSQQSKQAPSRTASDEHTGHYRSSRSAEALESGLRRGSGTLSAQPEEGSDDVDMLDESPDPPNHQHIAEDQSLNNKQNSVIHQGASQEATIQSRLPSRSSIPVASPTTKKPAEVIDIDTLPSPPAHQKRLTLEATFESLNSKKIRRTSLREDVSSKRTSATQPPLLSTRSNRQHKLNTSLSPSGNKISTSHHVPLSFLNSTREQPIQAVTVARLHPYLTQRRHPKWWFLDGSVILRLQQGPTSILFRLHRSFLVGAVDPAPTYFQELFNQPTTEPTIENCPVYQIPATLGLALQDFEVLLEAMHQGIGFIHNQSSQSFAAMASILRAATILQVSTIRDWALATFCQKWDPVNYFNQLGNIESEEGDQYPPAKQSILLARFLGEGRATTVLKPAFYELLRQPECGFINLESGTGSIASSPNPVGAEEWGHDSVSTETQTAAVPLELCPADIHRLVRARAHLTEKWLSVTSSPRSTCATIVKPRGGQETEAPEEGQRCCDVLRSRWLDLFHSSDNPDDAGIVTKFLWDPISGLEHVRSISTVWGSDVWCPACAETFRKDWKTAKKKIWKDLDNWLCLSKYEGLE